MATYSVGDLSRRDILKLSAVLAGSQVFPSAGSAGAAQPEGQVTWGVHVSLAPAWFDPAETAGTVTPFMVMYALHDAMVKPMPGQPQAPSLAEWWSASEDALTYEFVLRNGAKFHNGDDVTAADVKFSFERYRGISRHMLQDRVAAVEIPDARRVRFKLKQPSPDFLTFYVEATGAGWIVPKKYVETVGEEGFKKAPVGAGPYRFVSFTPGLDLTLEAFDQYWRKVPRVKRLVFRMIPDEATRLVALKRGEVDIIYAARGEPRHRPRHHQPGFDARPVQAHRQHHSGHLRILLAAAGPDIRSGGGQAIAGRSGLPEGLRRRRIQLRRLVRQPGRGRAQQHPAGRHPGQAPAARAGGLLQRLCGEELQEPHPGPERRVRQRRHPA